MPIMNAPTNASDTHLKRRSQWLVRCWRKFQAMRARHHARRQLGRLTEQQLADFGASITDQRNELDKPFWRE
jgi:uncharacterized protein YjiS (DUF1127 family)